MTAAADAVPAPRILIIENDPADPPERLGDWLAEAGADLTVIRPHDGQDVPHTLQGLDALVVLGGEMGAHDDEVAPWLPAVRRLLERAIAEDRPALGVCLGAQLLAAATGGTVERGGQGPEIGAHLTGKRDAAEGDPLFQPLPMIPDVMQYHYDTVTKLPPGATLMLSATGYPHQAWRQARSAYGLQFHIECTAERVRGWARAEGLAPSRRLGEMLDEAEEVMGVVWRAFAHRFVEMTATGLRPGPPLPLRVPGP